MDSFVGKCGKCEFSCSRGRWDHTGAWGVSTLVIKRSYKRWKWGDARVSKPTGRLSPTNSPLLVLQDILPSDTHLLALEISSGR